MEPHTLPLGTFSKHHIWNRLTKRNYIARDYQSKTILIWRGQSDELPKILFITFGPGLEDELTFMGSSHLGHSTIGNRKQYTFSHLTSSFSSF